MALFKIEKGLATNLLTNRPNAVEGYCYFTTDDGKFYIDTKTGSLTGSNPTGTRVALNADYSSKLLFGEITQSSSSTLKVSTVNNLSSLVHGTIVVLKNNGSNTAAKANLNINNLGSKPIYVNGNPITANTWRANEVAILFYDANSYSGTTGVWSLIPGVTYIHPQYTARTGVPTANQTPAFGGTFSVNQITSDSTGHVTAATSRTITIPSTLSNGTGTAGLIKTSSTVTSNSGYTACPVINGVPYYKDTNTTYTLGSFGITVTAAELNYSSGLTENIQTQLNNKSSSTHTHHYAGSSSVGGSAASAVKLDTTTAGDSNTPVYFSGGKPVACTSLDLDTSGNAATATKLKNSGMLDTQEKIDGFIAANAIQYATFKTTDSNNVGMQTNDGMIISIPWTSSSYGSQLAFDDSQAATIKVRGYSSGWSDWKTLLNSSNYTDYTVKKDGTGASGTWGISISGNAATATALTMSAGSATNPIYFSSGKPVACTYTLGKSVPSDAKFTDTVYTHPTSSGNKHIPSGGSSGQILRWSSDGTAVWGADNNTTYNNATTSTDGLMSSSDKTKLDGIATGATKITVDSALSSTSTNPVQNKVIYGAISSKADLDTSGKVLSSQLPSYVDDVLEYSAKSNFPSTGESGKIYVDTATNLTYRWSGSAYVEISQSLALGVTSSTAYRGDRGKIAYDHSQTSHAPTNAEVNQNAFSNVKVGSTTISADSKTDTLELVAGTNVTLTPDATNDKVTITTNDTKNTAGSTNTSSKIFLIGATSQAANPQTYSHDTAYVGTDGCLYSNSTKVSVEGHTHNYAGSSSAGGSATSAVKLDSSAGSATQPVYFSSGKPVACTYTLGKSVPSDAKFTDTTYTSLKNPYALTIQGNGTTLTNGTYDGSAAKTVNITPANIGAAASSHTHSASNITAGTLGGKVVANTSAVSALTDKQIRNITISTSAPVNSQGENGDIWLVY